MKLLTTRRRRITLRTISVPSTSGLRDETYLYRAHLFLLGAISVPSTSGLRDETMMRSADRPDTLRFQYPQPRVYAMKHAYLWTVTSMFATFSTLNLGSTR